MQVITLENMAHLNKVDLNELVSENQTIKIVPSVEDFLSEVGLNVNLDENTKSWFDLLITSWKTWKKSAALENHLCGFFSSLPDPFRVALIFTIKCKEFKDCKPKTLPFFIIETLQKYSTANGVNPEDSIKLPAFHIAVQQRNHQFLKLLIKCYQVSTIKTAILPFIKNMIKEDNCRLASHIVVAMELQDEIPVEDLVFPLILQDKPNMIDEYLSECPAQVKPLLEFLDKLLDKNYNIREHVQTYLEENKIAHVKYEKLHYKPLGKLVARLCNKFNIPIETCKNLSKNRTTGGLRYLIFQKYQENKVSATVWDDLVKDSLRNNVDSAYEFIDMLVDYDRKEALKWAQFLNIPEYQLPLALRQMSLQETNQEEENWDADTKLPSPNLTQTPQLYYKLSIPNDCIVIIDTAEKFYDLMISNLSNCNVLSIDCEWKPSFGAKHSQVALLQIATQSHVYLIDTLYLNNPQFLSFWCTFQKSILENAEVIKIGFGLEQDLKEIKNSVVGLGNIKVKGEGLLDLYLLWKSLIECGLTLPGNSDTGGNSLSSIVESCFGLPLEKSEQCSNWELRPLRNTQMTYAALDAYVLLEIYSFLQRLCPEQGINFEETCNDVMLEGKKKYSKKLKGTEKAQQSEHIISAKYVKIMVEPSLSNLAAYTRYCGMDTIITPSKMLWHDVINLAISEERFILVSKMKCSPTTSFPQTSILDIGKGSLQEKLKKICSHFNICIKEVDFLSRCINCNSKDISMLSPNEVSKLCADYNAAKNVKIVCRPDSDDEDELDNFLSDSDCETDFLHPIQTMTSNKTCLTEKGAVITISDVKSLSESQKSATLCDQCGNVCWDEDPLIKSIVNVISNMIKNSI